MSRKIRWEHNQRHANWTLVWRLFAKDGLANVANIVALMFLKVTETLF